MTTEPRTFSLKYPGWFEKRQDVRRKLDRINNGTWESEDEQLAFLRDSGCAYGQGYFIAKPMSIADFEEFLQRYPTEEAPQAPRQ